jgi:DNA-binding CsgD family transcriptional regulator
MAFGYGSELGAEQKIMAELDALQGRGVLRLLDFLFVQKTLEGDLVMLDIGDDDDYGTILAGFFDWDDEEGAPAPAAEGDVDPDELAELAEALVPGTAMAVVLVEHVWAGGLFSAVEEAGGELLSEGFITEEGEVIIGAEVEAINDATTVIEEAHAMEAAARLEAFMAISEAAAAVEAAQEIRTAAAAEALSALIEAGIIEAAAANEAADALAEAGVIIAAAEDAELAAVVEAGQIIAASHEVEAEAGVEAAQAVAAGEAIEGAAAESAAESVMVSEAIAEAAAADALGAMNEAEDVMEAAELQEEAAIEEADAVAAEAGLREVAAIEEVEATEELAARLETAETITKSEKRVLHYLGTDLTFAMIADKLKLSRGAVKDRAGRIYKKLGVHTREEAVDAAMELGLLKG